jgi:hypothetical protein
MPTFGCVYEDNRERFWDAQPQTASIPLPPPIFACPWCAKELSSPEALRRHFSLEHPLELPAIYVHGQPLLRESVLRSLIEENDVELFQCSRCEVQIDGAPWQRLALPGFRAQFAQPKNSTWNMRLVHERSVDDSWSAEEYHIRFRIPNTTALNELDAHFIRTLVLEELAYSDLERFEAGLPLDAPAREYGGALGDYALGIILKERQSLPHAPIRFEEFAVKMRTALETLRPFQRPVALAVSSSIRFNLNDFHDNGITTATELEAALWFFRSITDESVTGKTFIPVAPVPQVSSMRAICPVDQVSHRLLVACNHLSGGEKLSLDDLYELQQLTGSVTPISEQDLAKIHVICAEGYLRLTHTADALPHLRAIQFDPLFKDWAQRYLEDIATYDI